RTVAAVLEKLLLYGEELDLALLDENQARRIRPQHLPAQLGADATAGPGDHDATACNHFANTIVIERHRVAPQHVLDLDGTQAARLYPAGDQFVEARDDLRVNPAAADDLDHLGDPPRRCRRHRDHDILDFVLVPDRWQQFRRSHHPDAVHAHPPLLAVIIEQDDRPPPKSALREQVADHHRADVTRPDARH